MLPKSLSPGWVRTEILGKVRKDEDLEASKADYEKLVKYGNVSSIHFNKLSIVIRIAFKGRWGGPHPLRLLES